MSATKTDRKEVAYNEQKLSILRKMSFSLQY